MKDEGGRMKDEDAALADLTSLDPLTKYPPKMPPAFFLILQPSSFILSLHGPTR